MSWVRATPRRKAKTESRPIPILESIPYPSSAILRRLFRLPILLWRLGMGPIIGRLFMILTTTGHKTGLPRRTAIEYHQFKGSKYVMGAWPRSDWYRNIQADARVTTQTASGTEGGIARRLTTEDEWAEAYEFVERHPYMRLWANLLGFRMSRDEFIAKRDHIYLLTFDPTNQPTPAALQADLRWFWLVLAVVLLLVCLVVRG